MTGPTTKKTSDRGLTRKDKNRKIRKDALREQLSNKGLIQQTIVIANKLADRRIKMTKDQAYRLKAAADIKLKLINKYLGDDKTLELVNDEDSPLVIKTVNYKDAK